MTGEIMTPDEAFEKMWEIFVASDIELAHIEADKLLCKLLRSSGYEKAADYFEQQSKWYA